MARNRLAESYEYDKKQLSTEEILKRRDTNQKRLEDEIDYLFSKINLVDGEPAVRSKKQTIVTGSTARSAYNPNGTITESYFDAFEV